MSNGLWWIPLAAGLQDGVNPCILMSAAATLLGLLWVKTLGFSRRWFLILVAAIIFSTFILNCGVFDRLVFNKYFETIAKGIYVLLALAIGFKGLKFLNQWFCLLKGKAIKPESMAPIKLSPLALGFVMALGGIILSVLATLWPVNYYVSLFQLYMMMPGQLVPMGFLIALYTLMSLWVVYLSVWILSLETVNQRLFKIVAAAIFLSASIGVTGLFL